MRNLQTGAGVSVHSTDAKQQSRRLNVSSERKKGRASAKNEAAGRTTLYRSVQALLLSKGIFVSIPLLKRTPDKKIVQFIRQRFTPYEVADFLPVHYIYPRIGPKKRLKQKEDEAKRNKSGWQQTETTHDQIHPVSDINAPLGLLSEIIIPDNWLETLLSDADGSPETDSQLTPFDPLSDPSYHIPDEQFTRVLETGVNEMLV